MQEDNDSQAYLEKQVKDSRSCYKVCKNIDNWCNKQQYQYLTARGQGTIIHPNEAIVFDAAITSSGEDIKHDAQTTDFTLAGGHTYLIEFAVNGINQTMQQGVVFAIKKNNFITDGRVVSQNLFADNPYNSGWANYFLTLPQGPSTTISIVNLGIDSIKTVNAAISIQELYEY